jgi:alpha-D-ribose 1-methylphosphonate 5-triphosphate synthase subunit PhnI
MYVAVKGGEQAIGAAHELLAEARRDAPDIAELSLAQIGEQLSLAVDRVMIEGSIYDRELAALAIKQARVTTLPVDTGSATLRRRISATFKDLPGGQMLGATFDYTHRLLDFALAAESASGSVPPMRVTAEYEEPSPPLPRVTELLDGEGLIERNPAGDATPLDLTREPLEIPVDRSSRLQNLARGDEGFLLALAYSTQRGYANNHPFAGEIRIGEVTVEIVPPELGFAVAIGEITVTECEMVNQFQGSATIPPQFTRGYGLTFGEGERKAMAMALVDRSLRAAELGEECVAPAQDPEFVLYHSDSVEASGFVQHLKLPHYVDFQAELNMIRRLRRSVEPSAEAAE